MKKILLVDDDLKNSMLLKRFIEAERLYMPLMAKWDWNYTETSIPI